MGHLNGFFVPRGGNLNKPIFKSSNARGVARGGMLNFRIDRRIINISVISVKAGIISENIRCEISANIFFTDLVFESMLRFFLLGK